MRYEKLMNITVVVLMIMGALLGIGAYTENMELIINTSFAAGGLAALIWLPAVIITQIMDSFDDDKS